MELKKLVFIRFCKLIANFETMTINVGGQILDFAAPKIMGILNITPDSFYDGGAYNSVEKSLARAAKMIEEGADIIDIGAVSTRPKASFVSESDELNRIIPVVEAVNATFPDVILSIDTYRSGVLKAISQITPFIINDISAGTLDPNYIDTAAELNLPYILTHMSGSPENMQDKPTYSHVTFDILNFLKTKLALLGAKGLEEIIIDPGFGFGKTVEHNYQILRELDVFKLLHCPILAGLSRKSMIYKPLSLSAKEALNGSTALHMVALLNGADILRVHDVKEAVEIRMLWAKLTDLKG